MKDARSLHLVLPPTIGVIALASCWTACESVPEIRFVDADADAAATDASVAEDADQPAADAAPECSLAQPEGGGRCCGGVWCVGTCSDTACSACASAGCLADELCCVRPQNVQCKSKCP